MQTERVEHTIPPIFDKNSKICILGTMPSPVSRSMGFYYGHPQNRFWRVLSMLLSSPLPQDNEAKKQLVLCRHIALWDVLASCKMRGAADSSISDPQPNDIAWLLKNTQISHIFTTGAKAHLMYAKFCMSDTGLEDIMLPSTSPANARFSLQMLLDSYSVILKYI